MAGFGDFGGYVGEWAAQTGEQFNEQWYNAAPGEYRARMEAQAMAWRNNRADAESQRQAELLRKRLEEERRLEAERRGQRDADFRRWTDLQQSTAQGLMSQLEQQNQTMRQQYDAALAQQQRQYEEQERARQAELAQREQERQARIARQQQTSGTISAYQSSIDNAGYQAGGVFNDRLNALRSNYREGLAGFAGSDNPQAAQAYAQQMQARYGTEAGELMRQYTGQIEDTQRLTGQASQRGQQVADATRGAIQNQQSVIPGILTGVTNQGWGLQGLAQNFAGQYGGLLNTGIGQIEQTRQGQEQTYGSLNQGAYNPDAAFAQRRDQQLADSDRVGFLTNLYNPAFTTLQGQYAQLNPLAQQAIDTYTKTYGYDQNRLQQFLNPITQQQQAQQAALAQQTGSFNQGLTGLLSGLESGMYSREQQAMKQAQQASVNQQLRAFEQGIMGQLSQYYNTLSDFATRAQNEFTEQKAFRINEKQGILAKQEQQGVQRQMNQAQGRRESSRAKQLMGVGGLYGSLLDSLTRGN